MKNKYVFTAILLAVLLAAGLLIAYGGYRNQQMNVASAGRDPRQTVRIVTSFYPVYIAAENVIGDTEGVELSNMTGEQTGCLHDYQMTTEDMKKLADADVFLINGGGIESFLETVVEQYPDLVIVNTGAALEEDEAHEDEEESHDQEGAHEEHAHTHGEENAHYWMDPEKYRIQVEAMAEGLAAADPARAEAYRENAAAYESEIQTLIREEEEIRKKTDGQPVVIFHEAYEYLAEGLGMEIAASLDLDEERQVSANELAGILDTIQSRQVPAVFAEALYGEETGRIVEQETGVQVLYPDTLVRGSYDPDAYLNGMRENFRQINEAFHTS